MAPPEETLLRGPVQPVDLPTVLRLAGVQNPELQRARQLVVEAVAFRQLAAANFLPTINPGFDYDTHTGPLQQSNGNILSVNRSSLYVGGGSTAIAAGTVNVPGVMLAGNLAEGIYRFLASRQHVVERQFQTEAVRNQTFLRVALAYSDLVRAEGHVAVAREIRDKAQEVARITATYARTGAGRLADADRAASYLRRRQADVRAAEGRILTRSARLSSLLNLDPSTRLQPTDAYIVPMPVVPDPIPLPELIAMAVLRRPELNAQRSAIRQAMLLLDGARVLPFSPTSWVGFSAGGFGGGSNLVRPIFGGFGGRTDFDIYTYWSIRNMGVGNVAMIRAAEAHLGVTQFEELTILDMVRDEVAESYARTHARYAQIGDQENAVRSSTEGFRLDLERIRGAAGLPIEVIDSLRLLDESKTDYLDAIVDYNQAQFELYVALGQPPADSLAHPVPAPAASPGPVAGANVRAPQPPAGGSRPAETRGFPPVPAPASPMSR